jgi:hypothetical protein
MKMLFALAVVASALATGVSVASTPSGTDVLITRDSLSLPAGCGPGEVANLITRFFDAFNGREWGAVDQMFAPAGPEPPDFQLFGVDREVVYKRDQLLSYLTGVRSRGEHFRLVVISVGPERSHSVGAHYAYERSGRVALGKGLIDCSSQRIWQGAMGTPGSSPPRLPCPRLLGWLPSGPVLACSRGANAPALAESFKLVPRSTKLSGGCGPQAVSRRLTGMLTAFNGGVGDSFARDLTRRATFQPRARAFRQSREIAAYASSRYHAGEGWTATRLERLRAGGRTTPYRLSLEIVHQTKPVARGRVLVTVDCASGLVSRWLGPGVRTPT